MSRQPSPPDIGHNSGASPGASEENDAYLLLADRSLEDILRAGQRALFARLVAEVQAGTASDAAKNVLRQILKDNGMILGVPPEQPQGDQMDLPEYDDPEYADR